METVTVTLQALVKEFVSIAHGIRLRRWRLGEIYNSMCKVATANAAVEALREAMPDAKDVLGYAMTKRNLEAMGNMARTFAEQGRVVSPDGSHEVTREDIEALRLTPQQTSTLADLLKQGKVRVKSVATQARKASKAEAGSDKHDAAKDKVLSMVKQATDGKPERTVATIVAEIEAVDKQIASLTEKRKALQDEMVKLRDERHAPIKHDAPKVEAAPPPRKAGKRRPRKREATATA